MAFRDRWLAGHKMNQTAPGTGAVVPVTKVSGALSDNMAAMASRIIHQRKKDS